MDDAPFARLFAAMVASFEHPMSTISNRLRSDTAHTRGLPPQHGGEPRYPRVPLPFVSEQMLWYRADFFPLAHRLGLGPRTLTGK